MRLLVTVVALFLAAAPALAQDGPPARGVFGDGRAERRLERPRTVDIEHYVTIRLRPLHPNCSEVTLDFGALSIQGVTAGGAPLKYEHGDGRLRCQLQSPIGPDRTVELRVRYRGTPTAGLYFVGPDAGHPDKPWQVWSQGEPELNHHWFPCWDKPNDFATVEAIYRVPPGMTAIANGALVKHEPGADRWTWHWRQDAPQVSYLVSVVAGQFEKVTAQAGTVPLEHYIPKGWPDLAGAAERSFGKTGPMVQFMEQYFGVPYPYAKYAHVCVVDFLWGGMENASNTTLTANTLTDARAHLDWKSDGLVIHELAHQWFGDTVTCRDWPHIWLNEGFASYCEALWTRHEKGDDEYRADLRGDIGWYTWEDGSDYRRSVVTETYLDPDNLFDGHTYSKGARILHMLHELIGDEAFRAACKRYLETHRCQPVVTADLRRACEAESGRDLGWFFEQWCHQPGLPELTVRWEWHDGVQAVVLTVAQTQGTDDGTPLFTLPCAVIVHDPEGSTAHPIVVMGRESRFVLPARGTPSHVRFDRHDVLLKKLTYERPVAQLVSQLQTSTDDVCARLEACEALGGDKARGEAAARPTAMGALHDALARDPFHGVRTAAARALASYGAESAQALLDALGDTDSRVRRAVVSALAGLEVGGNATVTSTLAQLARKDQSYRVQAEAVTALAKLGTDDAQATCLWALSQPSHREVVRLAGLRGLFTIEDASALERAYNATAYGNATWLVTGSIEVLRDNAKDHPDVLERLVALVADPFIWTRSTAMEALGRVGSPDHLGVLREAEARETDGRLRETARKAIKAIEERDKAEAADPQAAKIRALEAAARAAELRAEVQRLEAELAASRAEKLRLEADLAAAEAEAKKHPVPAEGK